MYSFDIFDTLITRCTVEPKGIFVLIQERIQKTGEYIPYLADNFYELRVGAEGLARRYASEAGRYEIRLDDIYHALATTACISEAQQNQLKKLEVETEYNSVLGIFENINLLKKLKGRGEHIVLISDMYLSKDIIRHMLCKVDAVFQDIPIYVSSEYGRTKSTGLYQIVKKYENAEFSDWVHYGDNIYADIEAASKLGIRTIHISPENIKEYEKNSKNVFQQMSIGVSKYIRGFGKGEAAYEAGCSLAGPVIYPYVNWVVQESMRRGIDRLYFVARDGWILKQIADIIIRERQYFIQTFYIYGSRKVWRLPAYEGSVEDFNRILKWSNLDETISLEDLAMVFQLKMDVLRPFLPARFQKGGENLQISGFQRDNICKHLMYNREFREYLVESQVEKRDLVIRYLQQEIDTSDSCFAFVELAGTGLTQKCLARLIGSFYTGEIRNFFYKLDSIQERGQCSSLNFYPSNIERSYMLELLCRAPHGQTEGYREEDGKIWPVLDQVEGEQIKAYHLLQYRDAVLEYVRYMERAVIQNQLKDNVKINIAEEYLGVITCNPPGRIAEYFCHMPFSSSGRKKGIVEFAPPVSPKQLRQIYFWGDGSNVREVYQGNSLDYALAVSEKSMRYKEKCLKYRQTKTGKWLTGWNRYLHTHLKPGIAYFCPWELLQGSIVIYGAGKVGQAYAEQARQRYARCSSLLWVDQDYERLRAEGFQVTSPEEITAHIFDRIIIAIHQDAVRQEVWDKLREMGIEAEKIYYG